MLVVYGEGGLFDCIKIMRKIYVQLNWYIGGFIMAFVNRKFTEQEKVEIDQKKYVILKKITCVMWIHFLFLWELLIWTEKFIF